MWEKEMKLAVEDYGYTHVTIEDHDEHAMYYIGMFDGEACDIKVVVEYDGQGDIYDRLEGCEDWDYIGYIDVEDEDEDELLAI